MFVLRSTRVSDKRFDIYRVFRINYSTEFIRETTNNQSCVPIKSRVRHLKIVRKRRKTANPNARAQKLTEQKRCKYILSGAYVLPFIARVARKSRASRCKDKNLPISMHFYTFLQNTFKGKSQYIALYNKIINQYGIYK